MLDIPIEFDISALIILIGLFMGFFLSFFFIKKRRENRPSNLLMGFLILSFTLIMLEGWLNYTGLMFKMLWSANFSEPLNFMITPLVYFFMVRQLGTKPKPYDWVHFIPFGLWLIYCIFFFIQPEAHKYNSTIHAMQLDIPWMPYESAISDNPWGLRSKVNELTILHVLIYNIYILYLLFKKAKSLNESFWKTQNRTLKSLRNSFYHFAVLIVLLIVIKATFKNDLGDHILFIYLTFVLCLTAYAIMNDSDYFKTPSSFLEGPVIKYSKSSLSEEDKQRILKAIEAKMDDEKYFKKNLASLTDLAKTINESSHHVSQVINEKLEISFFEFIAQYRIEEAKTILKSEEGQHLTIEEISERVGYNSKSAFNGAFKKYTSQTPSQYKNS